MKYGVNFLLSQLSQHWAKVLEVSKNLRIFADVKAGRCKMQADVSRCKCRLT